MRYVHVVEYYSAVTRNEVLVHAIMWMKLEKITLSEKKPVVKDYILYDSIYINIQDRQIL